MFLFKDKKSIADFANMFSDATSANIVKDAQSIIETQDPVLAAGATIYNRLRENVGIVISQMLSSMKLMAFCCVLALIAKIVAGFMTNETIGSPLGTWTVIWESGKWTSLILLGVWIGFAMFKWGKATAALVVMTREGLLAIAMTYDNLFTQRELRDVLLNHTLEAQRDEAVSNKGHLFVHFDTMMSRIGKDIERTGMDSSTVIDSVKKYALFLIKQYNTVPNLDANYLKSKAPDDQI